MATCRQTVNGALRKLGRLGGGREPRAADQADVLAALQGLYGSWVVAGAFGRLADVTPLADYTAGENQRIIRTASTIEITLPETVATYSQPLPYDRERTPYPSAEVDTTNRPPRDGAVVQIMDREGGQTETWLYDTPGRAWVSIDALQLDDVAPRSSADPEGLSACLAAEVADQFGADIGQATIRQAARFITAMTQRFSGPRYATTGVYC